jgi:hypothetical protein
MPMRLAGVALFAFAACAGKPHPTPDAAQIVTADLDRFWIAYDKVANADEAAQIAGFQRDYLDLGSPGLRDFLAARIGSAKDLVATIRRHPGYYRAMRPATKVIAAAADQVREVFRRWQSLAPAAVFPDVYFVIGRMNSGGTTSPDKILIGAEMFSRTADSPEAELGAWHRAVLKGPEGIAAIVAHEMIHCNQAGESGSTLLDAAIREGSADFLGELASGKNINSHLHEWAATRQAQVWREFSAAMSGTDTSRWLYDGDKGTADWPADLAYYVGYQISKAFYDKAADKRAAIRAILDVRDAAAFLRTSGYEPGDKH